MSVAVVLLNMCRENTIIAKVETHRKGIMGALAFYVFRLSVSEFCVTSGPGGLVGC